MSSATPTPALETTMQKVASSFADAWNRHDAKALAGFFTDDGDLINPAGRVADGRQEIEALFADEHSRNFRNSHMQQTVSKVRVLSPDLVVATSRCELSGVLNPANQPMPTMNAIATFVLKNEGGAWRVAVLRPMIPMTPPK